MANDTMPAMPARVKFHVTLYFIGSKYAVTVYAVDHAAALSRARKMYRLETSRAVSEETCSADCFEVSA